MTAPADRNTSSATHPPTLHKSQTHMPLPPPNLPNLSLVPTIDQEAELEESVAGLGNTVTPELNLSIESDTKLADNHEAIAIQNQQHLDHSVKTSLPHLYGISNLLQDFRPKATNVEFSSLISTLSQQLTSITLMSDPPLNTITPPICRFGATQDPGPSKSQAHTPSPPRTPTKRLALLPPSPETKKSTKRIKSYSTL